MQNHRALVCFASDILALRYITVADLGIDGRGRHRRCGHMESGGCAPSGGAGGRVPAGGSGPCGGEAPQKLKPKDTLEASHKALW